MVETFNLTVAITCFNSKFVDKNVQGLAMILEILKKIKFDEYKYLDEDFFVRLFYVCVYKFI